MKQVMMKGLAIAFFAMLMSADGSAVAADGTYCSPNGAKQIVTKGNMRYYYTCQSNKWILTKFCPVGGGICGAP